MGKRPTDSSPVPDRVAGAILLLRLRSQFVTSNGRGGRRYAPYAFTEQGVAMLSSVLRSRRAVLVNIEIMRGCEPAATSRVERGSRAQARA
jgi:hypothetical protein